MSNFFADPTVGGDNSNTTDDNNPATGLGNGGFWTRLVPMFTNVVAIANYVKNRALEVAQYAIDASTAAGDAYAAQLAAEAAAETATNNGAFSDANPVVKGSSDATKLLRFEIDGFTTGTTRTMTVPNASGTLVTEAGASTLTNKTLTSPSISSPTNTGSIYHNGSQRGNVTAVAAVDLVCSGANYFTKTVAGDTAFTFSAVPAGVYSCTLEVTHTSGIIAFPASVTSESGVMPTLTPGKTHLFMFVTRDGGARWRIAASANHVN